MSRTDLDPATLAASLRRMAGDPYDSEGGIEWVYEPIQARVLLDIADLLDENAKLRELVRDMWFWGYEGHMDNESQEWQMKHIDGVFERMRELRVEVDG